MNPNHASGDHEHDRLPARLFFEAVEQSNVAISITDERANILYANPAFGRVTGYDPEEVIGGNESMLSDRNTPRIVYETLWARLLQGKAWRGVLVNRRQDGARYLAELTITPVKDDGGHTTHYVGMHRDVTEEHALAQQVRNQKALFETMVDTAPVIMALLDEDGTVVQRNQAYDALREALGGIEPAREFLTAARKSCGDHGQDGFRDCELRFDAGSGGTRWFSCSGVRFRERDTRADHFFEERRNAYLMLVASEITELKRRQEDVRVNALRALTAEEELVESVRETLAGAIYQLQGPINLIAAAANLLERRAAKDPGSASLLEALNQALGSGRQALETLYGSMPDELMEAEAPVNLNQVLRDVLGMLTGRLLATGVVVDWQPAPVLAPVLGREGRLRGMFKQLIENALDAVGTRGIAAPEIRITTTAGDGCVTVAVQDNGPGIPEALRLKVFEPFYTTKGSAGRRAGMGLPMVQEVMNQHSGTIEIDPQYGGGCRFCLHFPLPNHALPDHDARDTDTAA
ncbi:MAG: nitrogen fixation negative regulator NifL [Chromatiales bacterium]|jgi:nitrogen fixation negative regulator NifL|nr:nitrogen fixation negative regulator NifL [Chromatiales bacterium]MDX9765941.1 nitrogen fixation negative regulator NifL [Ectothiorhodospiraceae bacterium]